MVSQKFFALAITAILLLPAGTSSSGVRTTTTSPDLEIIRMRVIQDLLRPSVDEVRIKSLLKSVKAEGSWPGINYADVSRTGFEHSRHLDNTFELSRAYKKTDSPWYQNPDVKNVVLSAL